MACMPSRVLFLLTQILTPMIKGLIQAVNMVLSSKADSFLTARPFSSVLVKELPHFLGYDFYPLIGMPPFSDFIDPSLQIFCLAAGVLAFSWNSMLGLGRAGLGILAMRCLISNWSWLICSSISFSISDTPPLYQLCSSVPSQLSQPNRLFLVGLNTFCMMRSFIFSASITRSLSLMCSSTFSWSSTSLFLIRMELLILLWYSSCFILSLLYSERKSSFSRGLTYLLPVLWFQFTLLYDGPCWFAFFFSSGKQSPLTSRHFFSTSNKQACCFLQFTSLCLSLLLYYLRFFLRSSAYFFMAATPALRSSFMSFSITLP